VHFADPTPATAAAHRRVGSAVNLHDAYNTTMSADAQDKGGTDKNKTTSRLAVGCFFLVQI
jgi:hypothetical protein